jgi:hypothetical protein
MLKENIDEMSDADWDTHITEAILKMGGNLEGLNTVAESALEDDEMYLRIKAILMEKKTDVG